MCNKYLSTSVRLRSLWSFWIFHDGQKYDLSVRRRRHGHGSQTSKRRLPQLIYLFSFLRDCNLFFFCSLSTRPCVRTWLTSLRRNLLSGWWAVQTYQRSKNNWAVRNVRWILSWSIVSSLICITFHKIMSSYLDAAQFDYVFAENGLVAFKDGVEFKRQVCFD